MALRDDSFPSHSAKPPWKYLTANTPFASKGHSAAKLLSFGPSIREERGLEGAWEGHLAHSSTVRQDELHVCLSRQTFALVLTISHITSFTLSIQFTPERPSCHPTLTSSLLPIISPTATKDNLSLCVTAPLYRFEDHCHVTLTPLSNGHPLAKWATSFWKHGAPDGAQHPPQLQRPKRGEGLLNISCKGHSNRETAFFSTAVWHCCLVFGLRSITTPADTFLQNCSLAGFLPSSCVCTDDYCKSTSHVCFSTSFLQFVQIILNSSSALRCARRPPIARCHQQM